MLYTQLFAIIISYINIQKIKIPVISSKDFYLYRVLRFSYIRNIDFSVIINIGKFLSIFIKKFFTLNVYSYFSYVQLL